MHKTAEIFVGTPPNVAAGDRVLCQTAGGDWKPRIALAGPRFDFKNAGRTCWLTVPTVSPEDYAALGAEAPFINWPAEDVRLDGEEADRG